MEKNFTELMDYQFTAKMEEELDDISEGKLDKFTVIKKFYDYINKAKSSLVYINKKDPIIIGNYNKIDIMINEGKYGKYIVYGNDKFNLSYLSNDKEIKSNEIVTKVIEKIKDKENAIEWKDKKIKYILKKGQYGHYIEEWSIPTNKKKNNYSINYLINKISNDNKFSLETDITKIINLINFEDIKSTVEYFKNLKKK